MSTLQLGTRVERGNRIILGSGLTLDQADDGATILGVTPGTSSVGVKDSDTAPTSVTTLSFQGAVVSVDVATATANFNFDGRYRLIGGGVPWDDVTSKPATATRWPTWTEVTSKPAFFPPSTHTHDWADIATGVPIYTTRWATAQETGALPISGGNLTGLLSFPVVASSGNKIADFGRGYDLWCDNTGSGSAVSRLWFNGPNGGEITLGPRGTTDTLNRLRVRAATLLLEGGLDLTGSVTMGATSRQMLNLYNETYGIGVQTSTLYFRSDGGHAWFNGGIAATGTPYDPGTGGTLLMKLDNAGTLTATGNMHAARFYDVNNTAYYLDPNGTSILKAIDMDGALHMGTATGQMLNLYSESYALGVQSHTLYFRSGGGFSWFKGGVHAVSENDPGGGTTLMALDEDFGDLTVLGDYKTTGWAKVGGGIKWDSGIGVNWYIYPVTYRDMRIRGQDSLSSALQFTLAAGGANAYLNWDNSNNIGFLNSARAWSLKVSDLGDATATRYMYAQRFYDSNNNTYMLDLDGSSKLATVNVTTLNALGAVKVDGGITKLRTGTTYDPVPSVIISATAPTASDAAPYGTLWFVI